MNTFDRVAVLQISQAEYDLWARGGETTADMQVMTRRVYSGLADKFDFIAFTNNQGITPAETPYSGINIPVRNDVVGLGEAIFDDTADFGSAGQLRSVIHLPSRVGLRVGPGLHEVLHTWANHFTDINGGYPGHWGFSSVTNGQLGGFRYGSLQALGGGLYDADGVGRDPNVKFTAFSTFANGANFIPYATLELYAMGLIGPDQVTDPIQVAQDASFVNEDEGIFRASSIKTVTIADIQRTDGVRTPSVATSQKAFRMAYVVLTPTPLTQADLDNFDTDAEAFGKAGDDGTRLYNFYEATGGRATMQLDGLALKNGLGPLGVPAIPIRGDFNGDGITDVGIYQPDHDFFALNYLNANAQSIGQNVFNYGFHTPGIYATPLVGDFNGDGIVDVGIYQPDKDFFALDYLNARAQSVGQKVFNYGFHAPNTPAVPIAGDFNGDGVADVGIYQPDHDFFALNYLDKQARSIGQNVFNYGFHTPGTFAVPIAGDFNGDHITDVGIYQPDKDFFGLDYINAQAQSIGQKVFNYGFHTQGVETLPLLGDVPVSTFAVPIVGDFNGDGITDVGIYQPDHDFFALNYLNANAQSIGQNVFNYGFHTAGIFAAPISGDFNGDGVVDVGIYQPDRDFFALNYINAQAQSIGQKVFTYGFHTRPALRS